jgi:hypothetical protein
MADTRPPHEGQSEGTSNEGTSEPQLGEVAFEGGFRRVSRGPEPLALARLRELLLDVALNGSATLRDALEGFESWRSLGVLCGTEWTAGARRGSIAGRRVLQRRLRALGIPPVSLSGAASLPVGSPVHIRGIILPLSPSRLKSHMSYIWFHSAMSTHNVRFAVEEGHDFFLTDEDGDGAGETACVIATRGHLVNAERLAAGDRVSAFGFTDRVAQARPSVVETSARARVALALRAGDDSPLLLRRVARAAGAAGAAGD